MRRARVGRVIPPPLDPAGLAVHGAPYQHTARALPQPIRQLRPRAALPGPGAAVVGPWQVGAWEEGTPDDCRTPLLFRRYVGTDVFAVAVWMPRPGSLRYGVRTSLPGGPEEETEERQMRGARRRGNAWLHAQEARGFLGLVRAPRDADLLRLPCELCAAESGVSCRQLDPTDLGLHMTDTVLVHAAVRDVERRPHHGGYCIDRAAGCAAECPFLTGDGGFCTDRARIGRYRDPCDRCSNDAIRAVLDARYGRAP